MGIVKFVIGVPRKNDITILRIKYDKNTTIKPTTAATIVFRAASTPALSPPERIHLIPPQIKNANATTAANIKRIVITLPTKFPKLLEAILHRAANCPGGHVLMESAKAAAGLER